MKKMWGRILALAVAMSMAVMSAMFAYGAESESFETEAAVVTLDETEEAEIETEQSIDSQVEVETDEQTETADIEKISSYGSSGEKVSPNASSSGKCGDNLTWTLNNGVLTISGTGAMYNYFDQIAPWKKSSDSIVSVVIKNGVTSIGEEAFGDCKNLKKVTIPDSITNIGTAAFAVCTSLTSIKIPNGITRIEKNTFFACTSLKNVTFPTSITYIGRNAFDGTEWLRDQGDTAIANGILVKYSGQTTNYTIPSSVKIIGEAAFEWSAIKTVTIPKNVTAIQTNAFLFCENLVSVRIPGSVVNIGSFAFNGCKGLKTVIIEEGVKKIEANAFKNCTSLTSVRIPKSVTSIGKDILLESTGVTIYGYRNSVAETYAKNNGIKFVAVEDLVKGVKLDKTSCNVTITGSLTLKATVDTSDTECKGVKWTSGNKSIATVNQSGKVSGLKYGSTTITATSAVNPKYKATCKVQVLFKDVTDSKAYYYKPVYWAADQGITNGYMSEADKATGLYGKFGHDIECTRAHIVTFLWRFAGKPESETDNNPFTDVDSSKYYYKAVLWAAEKGITKGYSDGTFRPDDTCLREHVATFLWRYAGEPEPSEQENPFNDVGDTDYYYKATVWANQNGIAKGYTSGEHAGGFGPGLDCLREHVVTFLYRYQL